MRIVLATILVGLAMLCGTCTAIMEQGAQDNICSYEIQFSYNNKIWHDCIDIYYDGVSPIKRYIPADANYIRLVKVRNNRTIYIPLSLGR